MKRKKPFRKASVAAYAALAASVGIAAPTSAAETQELQAVERYCIQSWRNAGIESQAWPDCTQEVIEQMLERVSRDGIGAAVRDGDSAERLELKRAVWRTIQRWRRLPRFRSLDDALAADTTLVNQSYVREMRESLDCAMASLSHRQRQIIEMWMEGWKVADISQRLQLPPQRISDEKYKAIRKLRALLDAA